MVSNRPPCPSCVCSASQLLHILRGRTLLALHHVELDPLALGERLEALPLDGRVVDEAVLLAVIARDEAKALRIVEPLDGASHTHFSVLLCRVRCVRSPVLPYHRHNALVISALTKGRQQRAGEKN